MSVASQHSARSSPIGWEPTVGKCAPKRSQEIFYADPWRPGNKTKLGRRIPTLAVETRAQTNAHSFALGFLPRSLTCVVTMKPTACVMPTENMNAYAVKPTAAVMPTEKPYKAMMAEKPIAKISENRRSTKPIMEKRRRARINNSLSELKNLILDALKKDNARHSKLEKADILEMTVKHLQNLQMQQMTPDPNVLAKFRAGFTECANEVNRFMGRTDGVDHNVRQRLLNHLANCLTGMNNPPTTPLPPVHVQVNENESNRLLGGVQLVPTRLPSGDIAFLLPAQLSVYAPSTVPISPASSTSSTSQMSTTSSPSPVDVLGSSGILSPAASDRCSPSPVLMHTRDYHHPIVSHCPVIVPAMHHKQPQSKPVWRPF